MIYRGGDKSTRANGLKSLALWERNRTPRGIVVALMAIPYKTTTLSILFIQQPRVQMASLDGRGVTVEVARLGLTSHQPRFNLVKP